ncbi:AI-2E family transporter [Piscirickettsia salmonis]|uniref:AI-2E family transporter n=1 Tax=Piscirickettsia salmonis TaxID=1238 RepID=UPI0002F1C715|nr:AI-2E family transporter [Piscirickettsia salmonis]APS56886.1 permease [Piscirickettsia salmonis]ERL62600.1 hypothetical protein K661_01045 [Piscirickettsia salmonis LF-89 = ATCC VR-1361]PEQ16805.1 AI-2E family transporter [Piscirickettsia salmonis]QGN78251.1 pheromone autoinducer 2 transporter [Piscirickettsia salmonis]QGN81832.1 pheromone autoinducer 2 transporter [Piscirickettsia salmonis]
MFHVIRNWFKLHFSDPESSVLILLLIFGFLMIWLTGALLAPVLAALVITFLLEVLVTGLKRLGLSRLPAFLLVYLIFIALLAAVVFIILPLLIHQFGQLATEAPRMIEHGRKWLLLLPERFPDYISAVDIQSLLSETRIGLEQLGNVCRTLLSFSVASLPSVIVWLVYLILVPLLVFFFMKDRDRLLHWLSDYLPVRRGLLQRVWQEVHWQLGNYVKGKVAEIIIVGVASYIAFIILGLNYAFLLAALIGFSVLIPYIGAAIVTFPVALVGFFQWGVGEQFLYLMIVYAVIQALDGNVLVPLLFSEAVNLHPVAIIVAVLFFGGLWGFWGLFFAIPLATLIKAVLAAWPTQKNKGEPIMHPTG